MKNFRSFLILLGGLGLSLLLSSACAQKRIVVEIAPPSSPPAPAPEVAAAPPAPPLPPPQLYRYLPDSARALNTEGLLSEICREVAGKVYYELKADKDRHLTARVAVVSAVPLSDLKRESEFGRLISEYLLTDLADRGMQIRELRLGKEIHILPQSGEFIMSRNAGELANTEPSLDYVVLTTFSNTPTTLVIQGRLVSLETGLIATSWRYTMPLNRELLALFNAVEKPFTVPIKGIGQ